VGFVGRTMFRALPVRWQDCPFSQTKMPIKLVRLIAIALLILGTVFRFAHLDRKVYWHTVWL
jgi:hypothetical protein